jgi:uncharacterized protein YecT (DUF1311 family)
MRSLMVFLVLGIAIASSAQSSSQFDTPEWKIYDVKQDTLRKQGAFVLAAEYTREKQNEAGICKGSQSTAAQNECLGHEFDTTQSNYETFARAIRGLLSLKIPKDPKDNFPEPSLNRGKEFDRAEMAWNRYRDAQCRTSSDQYFGGTIQPSIFLGCKIDLTRGHMHELEGIYHENLTQ